MEKDKDTGDKYLDPVVQMLREKQRETEKSGASKEKENSSDDDMTSESDADGDEASNSNTDETADSLPLDADDAEEEIEGDDPMDSSPAMATLVTDSDDEFPPIKSKDASGEEEATDSDGDDEDSDIDEGTGSDRPHSDGTSLIPLATSGTGDITHTDGDHDEDGKRVRKPIGEKLVERGLISRDQLEIGLKVQRDSKNRMMIGTILVELGFITESALGEVLTESTGVQQFNPKTTIIDPNLIKQVPKDIALRIHLYRNHGHI